MLMAFAIFLTLVLTVIASERNNWPPDQPA